MPAYATIGTTVKVGTDTLAQITSIGNLGGSPEMLDATTMADSVKKSVPGVQDNGSFEVEYLYDNSASTSDFRKMKALQTAGAAVAVEVTLPDTTKFASTAYVSTYPTGAGLNELYKAKLVCALQGAWSITNPSSSGTP